MRPIDLIRLLASTFLLATASLAVFTAPTHFLWMVAVVVTEEGHMLALLCIGVAVAVWSKFPSGRIASTLCLVAASLALTPILRAARVARDLPDQLRKTFGAAVPARPSPLVYGDLFRGISLEEVQPESYVYREVQGVELSLDFYRPRSSRPVPVVIVIHTGSWDSGDNKEFIPLNRYIVGRGFAVATINYRLAPRWPFPSAPDDVRAAMAFLRARAPSLSIDPNRIVLLGRSAGGQIALTVAYSGRDSGIRGVISFYGPTDLYWSWEHPENPWVIDTKRHLTAYLDGDPSQAPANYSSASPTRLVTSDTPPTLLLHGARDELVSSNHSVRLAQRLDQAGIPHFNIRLPWATHGFDFFFNGPAGQISTYAVDYFLTQVTR